MSSETAANNITLGDTADTQISPAPPAHCRSAPPVVGVRSGKASGYS